MPEFLQLLPPQEALKIWLENLPAVPMREEEIESASALNRVTARAVVAPEPLPPFHRSTVDGYAVRAKDTFGASDSLPAYLELAGEVPMGAPPPFELKAAQAALIHTGGMLPEGADAVVMVEHTQLARPGEVEVLRAVAVGENVLLTGEDVSAGQTVIEAGRRLRPAEIGGLMALGITRVAVVKPPHIGILSSGDEVVSPEKQPGPGQVRDANSYSLGALIQAVGGMANRYGILPDRAEALESALAGALKECDAVVITAGSSASTRDLTAQVIHAAGAPGVLVHGVNVRPGKPTILAVCNGKAVIGLPGNPVSALVIAGLFLRPVIEHLLGMTRREIQPQVSARLTVNLPSQAGREDWVPVRLIAGVDGFRAEPVYYKSNLIFRLAQADGLLRIPADANGLAAGETAQVVLL